MTARVTDGIRRACGIAGGMRDNEFAEATVRKAAVAEECDRLDEAVEAARQDMWEEGFEAGRERSIEDREAAAWVREHGGLDEIRRQRRDSVPRAAYERNLAKRQRQVDESHAALRRRNRWIAELEHLLCKEMSYSLRRDAGCLAPRVLDADGAEIRVGDTLCGTRDMEPMRVVDTDSRECGFKHIKCEKEGEGFFFYCADELTHKLPILDADGKPLSKGETVWGINGATYRVTGLHDGEVFARHIGGSFGAEVESAGGNGLYRLRAEQLTHQRPVLDADGVPIEAGETVWNPRTGDRLEVVEVGKLVFVSKDGGDPFPILNPGEHITHRAPVLAADGKPLREGDTVWDVETGDRYTVDRVFSGTIEPDFPGHTVACRRPDDIVTHMFKPSQLTHERPDSWERLEEDAWKDDCEYFGRDMDGCKGCPASRQDIDDFYCDENEKARDLVRRCRALAERDGS